MCLGPGAASVGADCPKRPLRSGGEVPRFGDTDSGVRRTTVCDCESQIWAFHSHVTTDEASTLGEPQFPRGCHGGVPASARISCAK